MVSIDNIKIDHTILSIIASMVITVSIIFGVCICLQMYRRRRKHRRDMISLATVKIGKENEERQPSFALEDLESEEVGIKLSVEEDPFSEESDIPSLISRAKDLTHED